MVTKIENPVWQTAKEIEHLYANKAVLVELDATYNRRVLYCSDDELEVIHIKKTLPRKTVNGVSVYMTFFINTNEIIGGLYFD